MRFVSRAHRFQRNVRGVVFTGILLLVFLRTSFAKKEDEPRLEKVARRFAPVIIQDLSGYHDVVRYMANEHNSQKNPAWSFFLKDIPTSARIDRKVEQCDDPRNVRCNSVKINAYVADVGTQRTLNGVPLPAIYYYVVESKSHYFITYGFYHAEDWKASIQGHDHDMELMQVLVRKVPNGEDALEAMVTNAHFSTYKYLSTTHLKSKRPWILRLVASLGQNDDGHPLTLNGHPVIFSETKGHGIYGLQRNFRLSQYKYLANSRRKQAEKVLFPNDVRERCDQYFEQTCQTNVADDLKAVKFEYIVLLPSKNPAGDYGEKIHSLVKGPGDPRFTGVSATYGLVSTAYSENDIGYLNLPVDLRPSNYAVGDSPFDWHVDSDRMPKLDPRYARCLENIPGKFATAGKKSEGRTEFHFEFTTHWNESREGNLIFDPAEAWMRVFEWDSKVDGFYDYVSNEYLEQLQPDPPEKCKILTGAKVKK